jgi:hypothetical protein
MIECEKRCPLAFAPLLVNVFPNTLVAVNEDSPLRR